MEIPKGKLLVNYKDSDGHTQSETMSMEETSRRTERANKNYISAIREGRNHLPHKGVN